MTKKPNYTRFFEDSVFPKSVSKPTLESVRLSLTLSGEGIRSAFESAAKLPNLREFEVHLAELVNAQRKYIKQCAKTIKVFV